MLFFLYKIILLCYFFLNITINTLLPILNKKLNNYVDCSISRNELYLEQQSLITLIEWPELKIVLHYASLMLIQSETLINLSYLQFKIKKDAT